MKNKITITVRNFPVLAHDHRTGREEKITVPVTREQLRASQLVGQSSRELIQRLYIRQGCTVLGIGKPEKRAVSVRLDRLYREDLEREKTARLLAALEPA